MNMLSGGQGIIKIIFDTSWCLIKPILNKVGFTFDGKENDTGFVLVLLSSPSLRLFLPLIILQKYGKFVWFTFKQSPI